MKKVLFTLLLLVAVMVGCSNQKEQSQQQEDNRSLEIIEVSIQVPEKIEINQDIKFVALVTQGSDKVDDAKEVKFEISQVGQDENEMIEAQNEGDGIYSINKTFTENGQYTVTAHVTARNMHSMPKKEFTVGSEEVSSNGGNTETNHNTNHESGQEETQEDHHHNSKLDIQFNQEQDFKANSELILKTTLNQDSGALEEATVRFEIIPDAGGKTDWKEAKEESKGVYTVAKTFDKTGSYHIQIHVNKEELHEHKIFMIQVK